MNRLFTILLGCLLLSGCQVLPTRTDDWAAEMKRIDSLSASQIGNERELAQSQYDRGPDDASRMRLAYALSRGDPSIQQLARSREVLSEISGASTNAAYRDLLDRELELMIQTKRQRGRILELEAQLEALKKVETEMLQNRDTIDGDGA